MSNQIYDKRVDETACKIILEPWLVESFMVSNGRESATIRDVAKKYELKCYRYSKSIMADVMGLYATEQMKQNYVQKCFAQYLPDDVSKMVIEFLPTSF